MPKSLEDSRPRVEEGSDNDGDVSGGERGVTWRRVAWRWPPPLPWAEKARGCVVAATGTLEEGGVNIPIF